MVVDTEAYVTSQFQGLGYCPAWDYGCVPQEGDNLPYGAPGYVRDIIGGSAYALSNIFGKYRLPERRYGGGIEEYMPLILLAGGAFLLVSLMKK